MDHIFIAGTSFCGSTTISLILGCAKNTINISESNWLVPTFGVPVSDSGVWADWDNLKHCRLCGPSCTIWTRDFRERLQRNPESWFERISEQAQRAIVVSAEKSMKNLNLLAPDHDNLTLVLFKHPYQHWLSTKRRPWKTATLEQTTKNWIRTYTAFLSDDYTPKRGKIFLSLEAFVENPSRNLAILYDGVGLPCNSDALTYWSPGQHYFGGNYSAYDKLTSKGVESLVLRRFEEPVLPEDEAKKIRALGAMDLYDQLRARCLVSVNSERRTISSSWLRFFSLRRQAG